jgi:hypothetical protein
MYVCDVEVLPIRMKQIHDEFKNTLDVVLVVFALFTNAEGNICKNVDGSSIPSSSHLSMSLIVPLTQSTCILFFVRIELSLTNSIGTTASTVYPTMLKSLKNLVGQSGLSCKIPSFITTLFVYVL